MDLLKRNEQTYNVKYEPPNFAQIQQQDQTDFNEVLNTILTKKEKESLSQISNEEFFFYMQSKYINLYAKNEKIDKIIDNLFQISNSRIERNKRQNLLQSIFSYLRGDKIQ